MDARWTHKHVQGIEPTMRFALRSGAAGTGKELGAVQYWLHSEKSMDAANRICRHIEEDARAQGYTILPDQDSYQDDE